MLGDSTVDSLDRRGALLKTAVYSGYRKVGRWWRPAKVRVMNHQTNRRTKLVYERHELEKDFAPHDFDQTGPGDVAPRKRGPVARGASTSRYPGVTRWRLTVATCSGTIGP